MLRARESDGEVFAQRIAYRCLLYITLMNSEVKLKMKLLREEVLGFRSHVDTLNPFKFLSIFLSAAASESPRANATEFWPAVQWLTFKTPIQVGDTSTQP